MISPLPPRSHHLSPTHSPPLWRELPDRLPRLPKEPAKSSLGFVKQLDAGSEADRPGEGTPGWRRRPKSDRSRFGAGIEARDRFSGGGFFDGGQWRDQRCIHASVNFGRRGCRGRVRPSCGGDLHQARSPRLAAPSHPAEYCHAIHSAHLTRDKYAFRGRGPDPRFATDRLSLLERAVPKSATNLGPDRGNRAPACRQPA